MTLRSSCSSSLTRDIITFVVARTLPGLPFLLLLLLGSAVPLGAAPAAPGFTVRLLGSQRAFDSRELIGKKVLVVRFQASWCKPCAKESAALTRLAERYRARGVEVLALHVQDTATDVQRFVREQKVAYPVALDPRLTVAACPLTAAAPSAEPYDRLLCPIGAPAARSRLTAAVRP